jgi:phosphohistidine phosphatase
MKTLYLARHAKSSWDDMSLSDHARPLNRRGERDAPRMGSRLAAAGSIPEQIISSTAVRAISTARLIAAELGVDSDSVVQDPALYGASASMLLEVARGFPDELRSGMIVAHDPGLTELAGALSGYAITHMPTCGIVTVEFDVATWDGVIVEAGAVLDFDYPKKE